MRKGLVIKKILLTLGAAPVSLFVSLLVVFVIGTIIKTPLAVSGPGLNLVRVAAVFFYVTFIALAYLIWRNLWKILFFYYLVILISAFYIILPHILGLGIVNDAYYIGLILSLLGLFSYSFKKRLFSMLAWKVIFIFCLINDMIAQAIFVFPQIRMFVPRFLFGSSDLVQLRFHYATIDNHISLLLMQIFTLLALYRLAFKSQK